MTTKFTPAKICDKEEAMKRMIDGEVFKYRRYYMKYVEKHTSGETPFRCSMTPDGNFVEAIRGLYNHVLEWKLVEETPWYDEITDDNHILCFVSDDKHGLEARLHAEYIIAYNGEGANYPYEAKSTVYRYATPVTADDFAKSPKSDGGC